MLIPLGGSEGEVLVRKTAARGPEHRKTDATANHCDQADCRLQARQFTGCTLLRSNIYHENFIAIHC